MSHLEIRRLGRTEMKPTAIGLGGGHLGYPEQTDDDVIATVRLAIERGINFVDTSPYYGASESRVGMALAGGWREKVYLQTKVGSHPRFLRDFSAEATNWSLENSFKELQTDYVDSVLIHGPRYDIEAPLGACLDVMLEWKAKGRIGHVGVGVRQHEYHRRAIEVGVDLVLSYLDYTLLSQTLAEDTIPLAVKNDVGILLGSPLGGSLLAGPEPVLQEGNEHTHDDAGNLVPATLGSQVDPDAVSLAHRMWLWCEKRGFSVRDLAIQFALNAPVNGNGIVLIGPANQQQLDETLASAASEVPGSVWQQFEAEFGVRV